MNRLQVFKGGYLGDNKPQNINDNREELPIILTGIGLLEEPEPAETISQSLQQILILQFSGHARLTNVWPSERRFEYVVLNNGTRTFQNYYSLAQNGTLNPINWMGQQEMDDEIPELPVNDNQYQWNQANGNMPPVIVPSCCE